MIDADVLLGRYPFRPLPGANTDPQRLKDALQSRGIQHACLASLHAVFYTDPQQGDAEALPLVVGDDFFLPVATINPSLHNWAEALARSVDEYGCRIVRLLPNYHSYSLSEGFLQEFLAEAHSRHLLICLVKRIEDERMHPPLMKVPALTDTEIEALAQTYPYPLIVLSAYFGEIATLAKNNPHLYFDIAFAETLNTMHRLSAAAPADRLLLSTHSPFFYAAAALSKVDQWQTTAANQHAVRAGNLMRLLQAIR